MSIRIVNLRTYKPIPNEILIKVDRSTPVGNPFPLGREADRDAVCDMYIDHFNERIKHNSRFVDYIYHIVSTARTTNIALGCWCAPKRCHAETIKSYVENILMIGGDK